MDADGECARTAVTARSAGKCLFLRGSGSRGSKNRIKKRSRVGPAVVRADGKDVKHEDVKHEDVKHEDVKHEDVKHEVRARRGRGGVTRGRRAAAGGGQDR